MLTDVKEHDIIKFHRAEKARKRWQQKEFKKNQKMEKPAHIVCTYRIYVQESYLTDLDKVEKNLAQK